MVLGMDEVAVLIAEGTSIPVVMAGKSIFSVMSGAVRDITSSSSGSLTLQPTLLATKVGLPKENNTNSFLVPLSVSNVAGVQGFEKEDQRNSVSNGLENPIDSERPSNAPLDPGDVAGSRNVAKRAVGEDSLGRQKADEAPVEKAFASGSKLVKNDGEKGADGLTDGERQKVDDLKRRDAEVRTHEQAHAAAGGPYAGAPRFRFVRGPDGKFYAVAGEVTIDTSAVPGNPQATIRKMQQVIRAALAPQEPSAQDRRVAAEAERKIMQARQEIREEENEKVRKAQEKQQRQEAEARGAGRAIRPEQSPIFDPEARFRSDTGGTGPARGTGLAGAGGLDVDASDVIDPKSLFSMIA